MRILIWGNCYPRIGGIETFVGHLAEALIDRGHAVAMLSDAPAGRTVSTHGAPVWSVPMVEPIKAGDPAAILDAIRGIRQAITAFAPDIIHYNVAAAECMLFDKVMQSAGIPAVATLHNTLLSQGQSTGARLLSRSDVVTIVSAYLHATIPDAAIRSRIRLIPNAVPARAAPGPYPARPHVFALGRMVEEKGFDTLIDAFASVVQAHHGAVLTLAGNGPIRSALEARAAARGIADAVAFPGWIEPGDVPAALASAAVVAMPSRWQEPFGLVALEAGHAARPCVAAHVGELPSIIVDGETGRLVPPDDPKALAHALIGFLADPAAAEAAGCRARQRMAAHFDFGRMVDAYVSAYECARRG
ncbi:glycosyltransferase family 4 protein [Sphingomonas sanxanigenens]|uniref:Glycosyltransferase subfamily 4-like N-terminal domain-containing protein n=1 Tax=Sphingomonas sanxanigenens DSM 19645 = NX02 TaxID=1123269 RepID=W0A643_9SPHN|nr:glycosyltransferase family 4 protein [Sphingomonas sanxanigenens]AHE51808.1 hypothetical protein NX02_00195 [Sphingomonas sanxanigenens DSM 19645 = NX02]